LTQPIPRKAQLYGRRWRTARLSFLSEHPLCTYCQRRGRITTSTIVDHIIPHKNDLTLFWDESNWQPLCQSCHDEIKQRQEKGGAAPFSREVGRDGWPVDQAHPVYTHGPLCPPDCRDCAKIGDVGSWR